jgi:uncharacterized protein YbjT (DUF2867 family)
MESLRSADLTAGMTNEAQDLMLVVGGTGKTGRRVVDRLRAQGRSVRVGSRSGAPPFDWEDRATWAPAVSGATAAYVSYFPDLAVPGAAEAVAEVARLAADAGVQRLVLLSGRGEDEAQRAERLVRDAFPAATVVRCSWFAQNFTESYLLEPVLAGEVALPAGDVPEPFVDVDDIADVATAALTQDGHAGKIYELTGPRSLTFAQAVEEIAGTTGRAIAFVEVPMEAYAAAARAEGVPSDVVDLLVYLFGEVLDGRNVAVANGVQRALGRPPRDFADFARAAATTGVWNGVR